MRATTATSSWGSGAGDGQTGRDGEVEDLPGRVDGGEADFVSRVFAPRLGIAEDPVTGSAHTILATWWSKRLSKTSLNAHQVSARGGRLGLMLDGDRVAISGTAAKVMEGTLLI